MNRMGSLLGALTALGMVCADAQPGRAEWRVKDAAAGTEFVGAVEGGAVPGLDLSLEVWEDMERAAPAFQCTITDARGENRAVTLVFCVPLDAAGWTWWHDPNRSEPVSGTEPFQNLTSGYYDAVLMASRYPIAVMDDGTEAICLAVPAKPGRAVRFLYDPVAKEFRAEFDFGLSKTCTQFPSCADATVLKYTVPARWAFRRGLERYYELHSDLLRRRAGMGGSLLRGAPLDGIANPEDFRFAWHDFSCDYVSVAEWAAIDERQGVESYLYREPQTHWRHARGAVASHTHVTFDDGTPGPLAPRGEVTCDEGRAFLEPGAALVVPGFPTEAPEGLEAEFTLEATSGLLDAEAYEIGWRGPFWCGLRRMTDGSRWVGGWNAGEGGARFWTPARKGFMKMTLRMVVEPGDNRTRIYAAYDDLDTRSGDRPARLRNVAVFP